MSQLMNFNFHITSRPVPEVGHKRDLRCQLRHIKWGVIFKLSMRLFSWRSPKSLRIFFPFRVSQPPCLWSYMKKRAYQVTSKRASSLKRDSNNEHCSSTSLWNSKVTHCARCYMERSLLWRKKYPCGWGLSFVSTKKFYINYSWQLWLEMVKKYF